MQTRTIARFMFSPRSCLYHSELLLLVSSAALSTAKLRQEKNPDSPPLWLIKHEHSAGPQLASPVHPPHSPSFAFPSNPISNSLSRQLKMGWWKLCKCDLFVMLFFCIRPHHAFLTLQRSGAALASDQKGDGWKKCGPPAQTRGYEVYWLAMKAEACL